MEFIEELPLSKIHFLKQMTFKEFKVYCSKKAKSEDERKKQYSIIQGFCDGNIKSRGQMKRIYSYTQRTPLEVGGRLYCGNSLQGLSKQFRGFLCDGITTDIDMKNAHPTIARFLCKQYDILCPNLSYYIENRDEVLSRFGSDGKEQFLKALNDDKLNKKETNKFFKDFDRECKDIQKKITQLEDFEHIVKSVPDTKLYNWLGSAFNRILCVYENKILQIIISVLNKKQINLCAPFFDGALVYGNYYDDKNLLNEIMEVINNDENFKGLNMVLDYKQHYTDIVMPDEWTIPKKEDATGVWNDKEAAELVYEIYPDWVFCKGDLYVYDKKTGLWDTSNTAHYRIIQALEDRLFILTETKDGDVVRTKNSYGNTISLTEKLPKYIKTLCENNNWIDEIQFSSLGKILFTNGYYDFRQGKFFPVGDDGYFNSPDILFMGRINRSFDLFDEDDCDYIQSIRKRFFHDPLGKEMGDYMVLNLARGLAGDKMKRILFGLGGTNCGKSVLTMACKLSCGDYVGTFNAENLSYRQSSNDEASIMRWTMLLRFKRLIFSNEIKTATDLNGTMIKKISSGGDSVVGRCHGGNETEYILHFLAVVFANDLPKIKPCDDAVYERMRVSSYDREFVENPSNEFEMLMDKNIESEMLTDRFQRCFVGLLIQEYLLFNDNGRIENEPIQVLKSKKEWVEEEKSYINIFKNEFNITDNSDDWIESSHIQAWIDEKKLGITMTKFGKEMNKYTKLNSLENVISFDKKIGGKTKKCWRGIKMINGDNEIEE